MPLCFIYRLLTDLLVNNCKNVDEGHTNVCECHTTFTKSIQTTVSSRSNLECKVSIQVNIVGTSFGFKRTELCLCWNVKGRDDLQSAV